MNYRHAYHAGGPADVFKHVVLIALIERMKRKDAPFMLLDTHAGIGLYDLAGAEAAKTGEAAQGIGSLLPKKPATALLRDYLGQVQASRHGLGDAYPGSPLIALGRLRPQDRAVFCELHPDDHAALKRTLKPFRAAAVHSRDGYEMIGACLPPPERRGLILVDPPFEKPDEFDRALQAIAAGRRRFPGGVFALWYPIKDRAAVWTVYEAAIALFRGSTLAIELMTGAETDGPGATGLRLNGSGMLLVNPPYGIEGDLSPPLRELQALIAPSGTVSFDPLTPE